jgi:hypothetical protein
LLNKAGTVLVHNDDGYNSAQCGFCSYLEYTNSDARNALIATLVQACFTNTTCNATMAYSFRAAGAPPAGAGAPPLSGGGGSGGATVTQSVTVNTGNDSGTMYVALGALVLVVLVVALGALRPAAVIQQTQTQRTRRVLL